MRNLTRARNMVRGAIALTLMASLSTLGVKWAYGYFDGGYTLTASFDRAGQGLIPSSSEVKLRGFNVGEVESIELVDGRAVVTMRIHEGERIPQNVAAAIRPKTLFGDKFIALVPPDGADQEPYFSDGDTIPREQTQGAIELERVLEDLYPIVREIDPAELSTIVGTLADSARGEGPTISQAIQDSRDVLDVQAAHDADLRQFLADLARLSNELNTRASDVITLAENLNTALPTINDNADDLNTLLRQASRLAGDAADLIRNNEGFFDASYTVGQRSLQLLYEDRANVVPLVVGLRSYLQTLAEIIRIPVGDGTEMAAIKGILAGQLCAIITCPGTGQPGLLPALPEVPLPATTPPPELPDLPLGLPLLGADGLDLSGLQMPGVTTGEQAILDLVLGTLR
ncbi:MAG: MlaD family protein [Acidimicrobiales bacterium]